MIEGWDARDLGELIDLNYGKDHKHLNDGNIPCLGSGGLMRYVDQQLSGQEAILIPRKGSLNNIQYANSPFWTVDTLFWGRVLQDKIFGKFLFYQLRLLDFTTLNVGSAVPSLTVSVINEIEVTCPPPPEQKAIAGVLSSLDDKIDLLHRQNKTLEALAETLFRQWFIKEAQDDWPEVELATTMKIGSGKSLKRDRMSDTGQYQVLGANGEIGRTNEFLFEERLIYTGRVGTLGNVFRLEQKKVWLSDNTLVVKPKNYFNFIYFVLKLAKLEQYNAGSTQPLIRQSDVKEILILLPPLEKLKLFENKAEVLFSKIEANLKQIQTLEKLRDTLLPKLMSGEVRVDYDRESA